MVEYRWVFYHVGFFVCLGFGTFAPHETDLMEKSSSTIAQQIAQAATEFEQLTTGHAPTSVTVVLNEDMLVIALRGVLSPAEKALARNPKAAAQLQEYHRQLFANASAVLRQDIERITGVEVREATAEVETITGAVTQVSASGTVVQVYLLARNVPTEIWTEQGTRSPS